MTILCELDARQEIERIEAGAATPMRKTRCLLRLSQQIRHSIAELERDAPAGDGVGASGVQASVRALRVLYDDVRVRAFRTLRASRRFKLGFGYGPSSPLAWGRRSTRTR